MLFFYNGKNFLLRGGAEHRDLKLSQIKKNTSEGRVCYSHTENSSKNRGAGVRQLDASHKVVHQFKQDNMGERCHVLILDTYFSKLPACAWDQDTFYLRPLCKVPESSDYSSWFTAVLVGKNTLSKMVKTMCEQACIPGKKTNHSLRASAISKLFQSGVPEKVIQDRSGYRSMDGLR